MAGTTILSHDRKGVGLPVESQQVAFGALYLRLRQEGFHTGLDQQLRMQELLDKLNCGPADLKTVLCPIFASNPTQQAVFYRVFDEVFSLLADAPAPAQQIAAQENNAEPVRQSEWASRIGWLRRARWLLMLAVFVGGGLLFRVFHNSNDEDRPIPLKPTPIPIEPISTPSPVALHVVNLPLPANVPFTHPDAHWIDFAWSLIFTPLLAYVAFATYRYLRRRASRNRQSSLQEPHFWPLQLEALGSRIFDAADVRETARRMRQREDAMQFTLDVPATITATIRGHGFPNFRYRAIRRPPEYVVFIERVSQADQFAALTSDLVQMLQAEGVLLFRYYFEGTPRRLFTESGDQIDLLDLAPRTSDSRLLLFASSGNLFHPISGKLEAWVQPVFASYKLKSILLADAPRRKRVERLQDAGFAVVSANSAGVRQTIDFFESGGVMAGKAFPVFNPLDTPSPETADAPLHSWIAACAAYPELNWNLTLRLASAIDPKLACEREASKVARMPWFRSGEIPASSREQLAGLVPERLRKPIQDSLYGLLSAQLIPKDTFAWENWQNTLRAFRPPAQSWRDRFRRMFTDGPDPLASESAQDFTFIQFLDRHPKIDRVFKLPERVRALVFEQGMSTFGSRTLAWLPVAVFAALLIAAVMRPWQTHAEDTREVAGTVVDESGRPFENARMNGLPVKADGSFDLVLTGNLLPVTTVDPYVAQSVTFVGGGNVRVVVIKPAAGLRNLRNEIADGKPFVVLLDDLREHIGTIKPQGQYNVQYLSKDRVWRAAGPVYPQGRQSHDDPARLGCDPEKYELCIWGASFRFDESGRVNFLAGGFDPGADARLQGRQIGKITWGISEQRQEILSFTAEPSHIPPGGDVTLNWKTTGAPSLQLIVVGSKQYPKPLINPIPLVVHGLTNTTKFQLQIRNVPNPDTKEVTVTVDPVVPARDKSEASNRAVTVQFVNGTTSPVEVYWVDFDGKEIGYTTLGPGLTYSQSTYTNHLWRFRQGGQVLANYKVTDVSAQKFVLQPPPGACAAGYVWREASPDDHVCVTPAVRDQTASQNAQAAERRAGSGDYGTDTCKLGYVWRDAFANDHVCVEPAVRDQAANDNRSASGRLAASKKSAY